MEYYTVKNFIIQAVPMTKFDYYQKILKKGTQHTENKWINGYYCNWNDYKFWLPDTIFQQLYKSLNDDKTL